ncbi:MAG: helix-turn-helix transcriptional regulator [Gammaproteobacteria bacterium]|nr:helix-turn-helix transcriptional regulator [Gammaproteobacteria bacterium]
MSVHQAADYLQLNEKKIYALVSEGKIPATKVTGKWMFPRELVDRWILNSAHGGVLTDRLIISGSDDPLLYRIIMEFAQEIGAHALISYTPTGTRLGLDLLHAHHVDACCIHWGPAEESKTRHPALIRQYNHHRNWVLIRAFRREQGLIVNRDALHHTKDSKALFNTQYRWAVRQSGAGAQRFLNEILSRHHLNSNLLNTTVTALSDRDAAAAVAMNKADVAPGARSAAQEYGLGFIPYGWETFDFTLPRDIWFRRLFQDMISRLKTTQCQQLAEDLGGYDLSDSGKLVWGDQ